MIAIDKYAYASKLKPQNPMEKLVFAMLTITVGLWADSIGISMLILLMMTWIVVKIGKTPFSAFLRLMGIPMSFLLIGVLTIAIGIAKSPEALRYSIPLAGIHIGASAAGLLTAARLFFKALAAVSCLYYLNLSTPMVDILSALRRLKCPKLLVEMMLLIYRFIFVLQETASTIHVAQSTRLGYRDFKTSLRSLSSLSTTLFIRAYRRSDALYTALESRGYDGELNVLEEPFRSSIWGYVVPVVVNLLLIAAALYQKGRFGGL